MSFSINCGNVRGFRCDGSIAGAANFILLVNCATDSQVKTQIIDNYASLTAAGYSSIIGLRDIYPDDHALLGKHKAGLNVGFPNPQPVPIQMHLSVLETEAWFLDEITHFERVDPRLSAAFIASNGFALPATPGESIRHPADTLCAIYRLVGKAYHKTKAHIDRTVGALSQEELYVNVRAKAPHWDELLSTLETALFPAPAAVAPPT